MEEEHTRSELSDYLDRIRTKGLGNPPIKHSRFDPLYLALDRINYGFNEGIMHIGAENPSEEARQQRKKDLSSRFVRLCANPLNPKELTEYAENISNDCYFELSEVLLGRAIALDPDYIPAYHRLSRIQIQMAQIEEQRKNHSEQNRRAVLAEQISEKAFELIDEISIKVVEDRLDSKGLQGKPYGEDSQKLSYRFSKKYS